MSENSGEASLEALQTELRLLGKTVEKHDKVLLGNGREGLVQTVSRLEGVVNGLANTVDKIADSSKRMEIAASILEQQARGIAKDMGIVQKRVGQVEKMVGPIVDWKRGIYLRITTVLATCGVIGTAVWWVIENIEKIKEVFK